MPIPAGCMAQSVSVRRTQTRPLRRPRLSRPHWPEGLRAPWLAFPEGAAEDTPHDPITASSKACCLSNNATGLRMAQGLPPRSLAH